MLDLILASHRTVLNALAQEWLSVGAAAFVVCAEGETLAQWPNGQVSAPVTLRAPVVVNGRHVGELQVAGPSSTAEAQRLQTDAELVAELGQMARNLDIVTDELINTQDQLLAIYDLTRSTNTGLSLAQTLTLLAQKAQRLAKVEDAFVLLEQPERPLQVSHARTPILSSESLEPYILAVSLTREPFLLDETLTSALSPGLRSLLLLPVDVSGTSQAVLGLINKIDGDFYSPDVKLGMAIAEYSGARIENALFHEQDLEKARLQTEIQLAQRVQSNLLPRRLPRVPGLDLWASSRPALQVGGDFYDFVDRPGQPFGFAVGDISGKGLSAALLMAMTRTVLRTKSSAQLDTSPRKVLARSNSDLYEDFTTVNMFATVFLGQFNADERELIYANAGHSPVVYRPARGRAQLLEADSTALGILPTTQPSDQRLRLEPGDVLVVATDGLNEAHNEQDHMFGYESLLSAVDSLSAAPAQEIASGLYRAVKDFSGSRPQDDDQTLVVLKGITH